MSPMTSEVSVRDDTAKSSISSQKQRELESVLQELQNLAILQYNLKLVHERAGNREITETLTSKDQEKIMARIAGIASERVVNSTVSRLSLMSNTLLDTDFPIDDLCDLAKFKTSSVALNDVIKTRKHEAAKQAEVAELCESARAELRPVLEDGRANASSLLSDNDRKANAKLRKTKARVAVLANVMKVLLLTTEKLRTDDRLQEILLELVEE